MKKKVSYIIKNNVDWHEMKKNEEVVDISNSSYFGFRAMEKNAKVITYDPIIIDSIIRIVKESKKFPLTIHLLKIDENTLDYNANLNEEFFLKKATRIIEQIVEINENIFINFEILTKKCDHKIIEDVLRKIYWRNFKKIN